MDKDLINIHFQVWRMEQIIEKANKHKQNDVIIMIIIDHFQIKRSYIAKLIMQIKDIVKRYSITKLINSYFEVLLNRFLNHQKISGWEMKGGILVTSISNKIVKRMINIYHDTEFYDKETNKINLIRIINHDLYAQGMQFYLQKTYYFEERLMFLVEWPFYMRKHIAPYHVKDSIRGYPKYSQLEMYSYDVQQEKLVKVTNLKDH